MCVSTTVLGAVNLCWVSPAPATADAAGEHENGRGSRTSIVSTEASVVLVSLVSPWPASMIDASENNSRSTAANITTMKASARGWIFLKRLSKWV